jgi:hypothetical protein
VYDAIERCCCQSTKQQGESRSGNVRQSPDVRSEKTAPRKIPAKAGKEKTGLVKARQKGEKKKAGLVKARQKGEKKKAGLVRARLEWWPRGADTITFQEG